ncbi:hypothetical protein HB364_23040 [Pseudoflavitalea sp. X16]|uniref:pectate lyase family protein n=1 Tax=Paraflavitalea devenefica TaxID=2716334 RepID=UPI00141E9A70|nr:hypothetical protein [Paraflavitalea devenefica]NII27979.1 hypothetical protein [Paraflavitalea devenefica]
MKTNRLLLLLCITGLTTAKAQTVAFPGAEGFGAQATGGRGGKVYHVTNLQDSGKGSFRDAVSAPHRIIVFDVAGVIRIGNKIQAASDITIAGQSAPGEGVVVYGNGISFSSNTIVRHIRFRGSIKMSRGSCTVVADNLQDIIFDHVSIQWGRWDNLHIKNSSRVTLQYCMIGESIEPQRFGALFEGPKEVTVHHNLWIDNQSRNPKAKAGIEYINNIVYNWGSNGFVGGHSAGDHYQDMINNYFIAGPNSSGKFMGQFSATDHVYHTGNYVDDNRDGKLNGRTVIDTDFVAATATLVTSPTMHSSVQVTRHAAAVAYEKVAAAAGASLKRDAVDSRLIGYLQSKGTQGKIFMTEEEAGGQPAITAAAAPADKDGDGMPDAWEKKQGLKPSDPADGNLFTLNKSYTNVEVYLNSLAAAKDK